MFIKRGKKKLGKPYARELQQLKNTFATTMEMDISSLCAFVESSSVLPMYAVGSGGSLSAAHLAVYLHQRMANQFAKAITPLEAVDLTASPQSSYWFFSAGGRNADINDAFKEIVLREPKQLCVTCARSASPLAQYARKYSYTDVFDFDLPSGRDGFLATNSLLAFAVLIFRAYQSVFGSDISAPKTIQELLKNNGSLKSNQINMRDRCSSLWQRESLIVLYGPSTQPAAFDLESKFTEAALGQVLLADYRNFAHGRHHWLAKRGNSSSVLAFSIDHEKQIAEKTISLLPRDLPVVHLDFSDHGIYSPMAALIVGLFIVALAGEARDIDPGRPGVPSFGRRIYHLRTLRSLSKEDGSPGQMAIARKLGCDIKSLRDRQDLTSWKEAHRRFVSNLEKASFGAILFDYDGTLCDKRDRFSGLRPDIVRRLRCSLDSDIVLGVATGRGKSARDDLRKALPRRLWNNVYIGYYNGADISTLDDDRHPDSTASTTEPIKTVIEAILRHPVLSILVTYEARRMQISVQPKSNASLDLAWRILQQLAETNKMKVLRSSHSIDLILPDVSKRLLLAHLKKVISKSSQVLLIGDKGQWPGNDHELLAAPYSLSVDEVSADLNSCWNLSPAGYRGVQATIAYLDAFQISKGMFKILVNKISSKGLSQRGRR